MIYNCLFESVWFTFRDKVAPAKWTFGSLQVVIRIMNDKLQEAEEDNTQTAKQVLWLSYPCMTNDCPLEMIYDSLFGSRAVSIGRQSDRNGSEAQPESRDEQGKIHPRQRRISKKWRSVHTFDSGCILPCGTFLLRAI